MKLTHSVFALGLAALCLATAGYKATAKPTPISQLKPNELHGRVVFAAHCGMCHYDREDQPLHGPPLRGVFKKTYLPSGAPANDERVRNTIDHGRNMMPALGGSMSSDEVDDLLAYMHTL